MDNFLVSGMNQLAHSLIAISLQIIGWLLFDNLWLGALLAIAIFTGREHAQAEYRWMDLHNTNRAGMPWYAGFDPRAWDVHSAWWNLLMPVVCVLVIAYFDYVVGLTFALFVGFFFYTSAYRAWPNLPTWAKIIVGPVAIVFGLVDILFDTIVGSILYLEPPMYAWPIRDTRWLSFRAWLKQLTFSQRCCRHYTDYGWRGDIARAFAGVLNAIWPKHIKGE